ncbi:MAG: nucleotidyl transferase AbiEii/AbiGii toxin family protein [Pseudonocardiaceae bacterium]
MDPRHRELVRVGLGATCDYGFALAGGYALVTHGLVDRVTEDVDLFTNHLDPAEFMLSLEAISAAYEQAGHPVTVVRRAELYARLHVGREDPVQVELAYDWRSKTPARFDIGPVLDRDDVVAGKVLALWGRQEARDYIDVYVALACDEYTEADLLQLAQRADAGFDQCTFGCALLGVDRLRDADFSSYGVTPNDVSVLRMRLRCWGQVLTQRGDVYQ